MLLKAVDVNSHFVQKDLYGLQPERMEKGCRNVSLLSSAKVENIFPLYIVSNLGWNSYIDAFSTLANFKVKTVGIFVVFCNFR